MLFIACDVIGEVSSIGFNSFLLMVLNLDNHSI